MKNVPLLLVRLPTCFSAHAVFLCLSTATPYTSISVTIPTSQAAHAIIVMVCIYPRVAIYWRKIFHFSRSLPSVIFDLLVPWGRRFGWFLCHLKRGNFSFSVKRLASTVINNNKHDVSPPSSLVCRVRSGRSAPGITVSILKALWRILLWTVRLMSLL